MFTSSIKKWETEFTYQDDLIGIRLPYQYHNLVRYGSGKVRVKQLSYRHISIDLDLLNFIAIYK